MPDALLTNVAGAGGEGSLVGAYAGPVTQDVVNTTTTAIPNGTLCAIQTPIAGPTPALYGVGASSATATTAPLDMGVAIGGAGPTTSIAAAGVSGGVGGLGQVAIHGFCRALLDASVSPTVVGHRLIRSAATAGALADAGTTVAAAGLNYGVVLEAVTISGTGLVNIWFEKT